VHESDEVAEQRVRDAAEILDDFAVVAGIRLKRSPTCASEVKLYTVKPFNCGTFNGLREFFMRAYKRLPTHEADPTRDGDLAVTPISSHRRGKHPVDTFSVMDDELVNHILGDAACIKQFNNTCVKLVPPFDFFLHGKLNESGDLISSKELVVKGHVCALVEDHEPPCLPIFRLDDEAFEYPSTDRAAYKLAMARQLLSRPSTSAEFRAWAESYLPA